MVTSSSPFGPLHLSCTDTVWLQKLVTLLVHEHALEYEKYVHQDQRRLNPTQCKLATQRDNLQDFSQQPSSGERGARWNLFRSGRDTAVRPALAEMPTLLLIGTIKGSLNDVMYEVLNPTVDSMRVKSSYVGDKFAGCAVLATLERPAPSDPFRSHTLKWFEGDHPYIFRPIVKNRDFVFMEATGITELAGGERVGYHVMHSVTFPGARAMNGNIRAHMAGCAFYKQQSDGVVEVFTKTTANPGGHVAPAIAVKYGATALVSAQNLVDCAYAKKLAWVVSSERAPFQRPVAAAVQAPVAETLSPAASAAKALLYEAEATRVHAVRGRCVLPVRSRNRCALFRGLVVWPSTRCGSASPALPTP